MCCHYEKLIFTCPLSIGQKNNKYDFRLANKFAQREFFKFFKTKDPVRSGEFAAIPILLPYKSLEKVKPGFLLSLMCMFHELNGAKF